MSLKEDNIIKKKIFYYFHDFNYLYLNRNKRFVLEFEGQSDQWDIELSELPRDHFLGKNNNNLQEIYLWNNFFLKIHNKISVSSNNNLLTWLQPAPNAHKDKFKNIILKALNPEDNSIIIEFLIEGAFISKSENPIRELIDIFQNKFTLETRLIRRKV